MRLHDDHRLTRRPGFRSLLLLTTLTALMVGSLLGSLTGSTQLTEAALQEGHGRGDVIIGHDDDNVNNPVIQPAGAVANQSLNNADVLLGRGGNDVVIGLLGSDTMLGGFGHDILIGGPEQGSQPNSDIIFGGPGNDINIWAPGDGSDAFIGESGVDALVMGVIDRDARNMPTLTGKADGFRQGVPTANVSGQGGFCTIERVADEKLGYQYLVRFFVRATGALAVTIRLTDVEQVFCTSKEGGQITFADLRYGTEFRVVSLDEVAKINRNVRAIIR